MKIIKMGAICLVVLLTACVSSKQPLTSVDGTSASDQPIDQSTTTSTTSTTQENKQIVFADNNTVLFDFDSSSLKPQQLTLIRNQAEWLRNHSYSKIIVAGYTDIVGTREYNLALGERRANEVKKALVSLGVPANMIHIISYGKERLVSNDDQAKNRRAVTEVID